MHEGIDAGVVCLIGASGLHEAARHISDAAALVFRKERAFDQRADKPMLVRQILRGEFIPRWETAL
jgi:hypothetical protein